MFHVPMCKLCGEYEVATFPGGDLEFCSQECADFAEQYIGLSDVECDEVEADESMQPVKVMIGLE